MSDAEHSRVSIQRTSLTVWDIRCDRAIKFKDEVGEELRAQLVRRQEAPEGAATTLLDSTAVGSGATAVMTLPAPSTVERRPAEVRALQGVNTQGNPS